MRLINLRILRLIASQNRMVKMQKRRLIKSQNKSLLQSSILRKKCMKITNLRLLTRMLLAVQLLSLRLETQNLIMLLGLAIQSAARKSAVV